MVDSAGPYPLPAFNFVQEGLTYTSNTVFREPDPSKPKLVLAYSGGLDTSTQLAFLAKERGFEVIAYIADLAQDDVLDAQLVLRDHRTHQSVSAHGGAHGGCGDGHVVRDGEVGGLVPGVRRRVRGVHVLHVRGRQRGGQPGGYRRRGYFTADSAYHCR